MFKRYLQQATHFLEFGCGGSTCLAATTPTLQTIVSVESDAAWIEKVRSHVGSGSGSGRGSRCTLVHGDIGPVKEFGHPVSLVAQAPLFSNYTTTPFMSLSHTPDLILIDGRFRVACALQAFLRFPNATILFHDFTIRTAYHAVLKVSDVIETVDTLVALRRKPDVSDDMIHALLPSYLTESG